MNGNTALEPCISIALNHKTYCKTSIQQTYHMFTSFDIFRKNVNLKKLYFIHWKRDTDEYR